ncbi:MAG TPA: EndoU domain-containing protein [Terriglobia bacterium]|nr:EndoU domain-containing protein [Terriglobia bacterium]
MRNRIAFLSTHVGSLCRAALTGSVLLLGLTMFTHGAAAQVACPQANSGGAPVVHNQHIFCGEINGAGRATGFHSRPGGVNPATVTNTPAPVPRAPAGVYNLSNFNITQGGVTAQKAISTMFPDACSQANVIAAIQNAVNNATAGGHGAGQFQGPSGASCQAGAPLASFVITGYLDGHGEVITAWPQ